MSPETPPSTGASTDWQRLSGPGAEVVKKTVWPPGMGRVRIGAAFDKKERGVQLVAAPRLGLQKPLLLQADEACTAHDNVIVEGDSHEIPGAGNRAGELDVVG